MHKAMTYCQARKLKVGGKIAILNASGKEQIETITDVDKTHFTYIEVRTNLCVSGECFTIWKNNRSNDRLERVGVYILSEVPVEGDVEAQDVHLGTKNAFKKQETYADIYS